MLQTPQGGSNLAAQRRFDNFWSNVSRIKIAENVPDETIEAVVEALHVSQARPTQVG